jgi:MYXO-CTERM domain-containing protein
MSKTVRCVPFVAFFLFFAPAIFADTLEVNFSVSGFGSFTPLLDGEAVSGSFLWNTQTNVLYDVSITSTGPLAFGPSGSISGIFVPPPGHPGCGSSVPFYSAGTLQAFFISDVTGTGNIQMNLGDHADCDPPVVPGPGTYSHEPFDLFSPSFGVVGSVGGAVTVSETPEPTVAGLLGLGSLMLAATRRIAPRRRSQ